MLVASAPAYADDCANADAQPGQASQQQMADATLCLLNQQRTANGLNPLTASQPLADTAGAYSTHLVQNHYFAHEDEAGHNVAYRVLSAHPDLSDRWSLLGENLGWGTDNMATPRAMVNGWMNSPTHRANVLYPTYSEVGIGIADGGPDPSATNALTYTTVFGEVAAPDTTPAKSSKTAAKPRPTARQCRNARASHKHTARIKTLRRACAAKARSAKAARAH
jgi:uncharacterized protein YkwD